MHPTQAGTRPNLSTVCAVLWVVSTAALALALSGDPHSDGPRMIGVLAALGYVVALVWHLIRRRPHADQLPPLEPLVPWPRSYGSMLGTVVCVAAVGFVWTGIVAGNGWHILRICFVAALVVIVGHRKRLTVPMAVGGLVTAAALTMLEFLVGFAVGKALYMAIIGGSVFIAGTELLQRSKLTRFHLAKGDVRASAKSLAWGCLLAVPPAMLNLSLAAGKEPSRFEQGLDRWWTPFYALQPAIMEEVWARLFLTTAIYALLRPLTNERPGRAIAAAILISTFVHGAAHYPTSISSPMAAIFIAAMYGVPLVMLFVKRSFEHAVAYHFFVNFLRFGAAFVAGQ